MMYASRFLRLAVPHMQGPDVLSAQMLLKTANYYPGPLDGVFGERTNKAVKSFQIANNILADGIIGPDTWCQLSLNTLISPGDLEQQQAKNIYKIYIDTNQRKLTLFKSRQLVKTYPVAVGKPETPTPLGEWSIVSKSLNPGGPFGARWMRLNILWGGYGIHGTDNPSSIGTYASHGCIRMYNEDVIQLYDLVPVGTPVTITGKVYTGRLLRIGSKGSDVKLVQTQLRKLGYYKYKPDGIFGTVTEKAVKNFQSDQGIDIDGIVGPITYQALQKAYDIKTGDQTP